MVKQKISRTLSNFVSGRRNTIANALASAKRLLSDASAIAQSTPLTRGDATTIATSVVAISEEEQFVAQFIAQVAIALGEIGREEGIAAVAR